MSYEDQRRKSSLDRGTSSNNPAPAPKAPLAPAKPVNTSSFLTRIANTAVRESGGATPAAARPNWMAVDHSSPAANLNSRLRWVENAFKAEGQPQPQAQPQQPQHQGQPQQAQAQKPTITSAADFKSAVTVMRKRMQAMHLELAELDKELAEIEQKMSQN